MATCRAGYTSILVESFYSNEQGHKYPLEIGQLRKQAFPTEMLVECPMSMRRDHPLGTVFRICAKWKQKSGCRPHLYTSYQWSYEVVRVQKRVVHRGDR